MVERWSGGGFVILKKGNRVVSWDVHVRERTFGTIRRSAISEVVSLNILPSGPL
jgi:hypothetical protein